MKVKIDANQEAIDSIYFIKFCDATLETLVYLYENNNVILDIDGDKGVVFVKTI